MTLNGVMKGYFDITLNALNFKANYGPTSRWLKVQTHSVCDEMAQSPKYEPDFFDNTWPMHIFKQIIENECVNEIHPFVKGDNLTNTGR